MVNERWVTLLIFIGFIGVLWHTPALAAISAIGLTVIIVSLLLKRATLRHIDYRRRFDETRVFIGEKIAVQCRATNASRLPLLSLIIRDHAPRSLVEVGPSGHVEPDADIHMPASLHQLVSIKPRSFASRTFTLQATRRGYFPFKAYTLNAVDLLGLSESERVEEPKDNVLVYPRVFPIDALDLPPQQPLGEMVALKRFIEDPARTMGARDYSAGDPFRMIHWKASAHRGALQTRVSDHTSDPTTMILLNVMTYSEDWFGVEVERFEWAVSVAASLAKWAHEAGATVGLSSNGCTPGRPEALRVRPRRSPDQLVHVLESLAFISAFTLARFQDFLITEQRHVPQGATLLIVSPMFNAQIAEAIYRLHEMGKRLAFVCVDHVAPDIDPLPCPAFHIPPNAEYAAFMRQFAAGDAGNEGDKGDKEVAA